ncbi:cache domain-containing protein [Methanoplanus endosymbiosus]|uniref:Transporter substrate-binding domain-containing protein n=1 Tax=Methanoplanus endosymbiosus TaxID=33865 RepID=A0A9E7TIG5_9EURY|nr:transporter substrate-binding domain-containing protein [Methanoplanus endosymbiosus]UUX92428.1 transporter substrate-binding domain-containing protein [Methanoplanus endosymbiosus]
MRYSGICALIIIMTALSAAICGCTAGDSSQAAITTEETVSESGLNIMTEEFPPFNYRDKNGEIAGQSTEIVKEILSRLNQKATIELLPWSESYDAALKEPNAVLYSAGINEEREPLFRWVGPIGSFDYVLYAKSGSGITINSLDAAKKTGKIGVVKDDTRQQFLSDSNFQNTISLQDDKTCLNKLMNGEIDLWFGSSLNAAYIAEEEGYSAGDIVSVYPVRSNEVYIAFNQKIPDETIENWQNALDSMKADGTYETIINKYGNDGEDSVISPDFDNSKTDPTLTAVIAVTEGQIKSILRPFEVLAMTNEVRSGEWQKIKPLLRTLEEKEPDTRLWYANTDGSYYTVVDDLADSNLKDRSYFPVVLSGEESVGTVVISHSTGKNAAIVAVPVIVNEEVIGILGASVYADSVTETLNEKLPASTVYYAIDNEGKFALSSEKGEISQDISLMTENSSFGKAVEKMLSEESGTVEYEKEGETWTAAFRKSPLTGWHFAVAEAV